MSEKKTIRGAEFLITETAANDIFIPEEWNEEQKMIAQMCNDFLAAEVHPHLEAIDKALETINEAWKNASEEMYKAQAEAGGAAAGETPPQPDAQAKEGDDVQDVDFEEVKE